MGSRLGSACLLAGALGVQLPLGNKGLVNPVDILLLRLLDQSLQRVGVGISVGVVVHHVEGVAAGGDVVAHDEPARQMRGKHVGDVAPCGLAELILLVSDHRPPLLHHGLWLERLDAVVGEGLLLLPVGHERIHGIGHQRRIIAQHLVADD